jgi:hypothetical protein
MTTLSPLLTRLAQEHLNIPTLETRRSDALDFHTVSVWGIADALKAAFVVGAQTSAIQWLDALLEDVMGSDDPAFTSEQVAFLQDRMEAILPAMQYHTQSGV